MRRKACRSVIEPKVEPVGMLGPIAFKRSALGFSTNSTIRPVRSKRKIPMPEASAADTGLCRDRDVGSPVAMIVDEIGVIHPVKMIAGENQVVVGVVAQEMTRRLSNSVRGSLIPVRIVRRLFRGKNLDKPRAEQVHPIGLRDMPIQRGRVELGEDENPTNVGMKAVADRDVDQPVFAADRNRRLRSVLGEREQPGTLTAAENNRQNFGINSHLRGKSYSQAAWTSGVDGRYIAVMEGRYSGSATILRLWPSD